MTDNAISTDSIVNQVFDIWGQRFGGDMTAKFTSTDVDDELLSLARLYIADYDGDFEFLVSVATAINDEGRQLTAGMAKGVLNCMVAEAKRSRGFTSVGTPITTMPQWGYYAVTVNEDIIFLRVNSWTPKDSAKTLTAVSEYSYNHERPWNMVAVADATTNTYNVLRKVDDALTKTAIHALLQGDKTQQQLFRNALKTLNLPWNSDTATTETPDFGF